MLLNSKLASFYRRSTQILNYPLSKALYATSEPNSTILKEDDSLFKSIEIEACSGEPAVLASYLKFAENAANEFGIKIGKSWAPAKPHHDRLTLLKSVHIYKKHRVQYEVRTYTKSVSFERISGSTSDTFLQYIQQNLPEGVSVKVTKNLMLSLPISLKKSVSSIKNN